MAIPIHESAALADETLVLLKEASPYFPATVSRGWLERMIRNGTRGVKLETFFFCNKRYTSKEAIRRFLERTQNSGNVKQETIRPRQKRRTEAELKEALRKFNLPDPD